VFITPNNGGDLPFFLSSIHFPIFLQSIYPSSLLPSLLSACLPACLKLLPSFIYSLSSSPSFPKTDESE
jgi:hypothetical protein